MLAMLRTETKTLKGQVNPLLADSEPMGATLEDFEGCSRRNNFRVVGVPERAEGPSAALFLEDLVMIL